MARRAALTSSLLPGSISQKCSLKSPEMERFRLRRRATVDATPDLTSLSLTCSRHRRERRKAEACTSFLASSSTVCRRQDKSKMLWNLVN
eukprot:765230-Hanusia_phi.AAC.3